MQGDFSHGMFKQIPYPAGRPRLQNISRNHCPLKRVKREERHVRFLPRPWLSQEGLAVPGGTTPPCTLWYFATKSSVFFGILRIYDLPIIQFASSKPDYMRKIDIARVAFIEERWLLIYQY